MPIKRKQGETKDEFISRCIPLEISSGKPQEQAAAICYSYWEEKQLMAVKNIRKKKLNFESYTDYPEAAKENAKIALRWADENGWGDCGTGVGKARANQLANGEPISEDTIARMAAFERHRQNSQKELGDGCGRLMWQAWGGDAGVEWAQRKLKEIRGENFFMNFEKQRVFVNSSNVSRMMWNSETFELVIKFNDGSYYTYFEVDEDTFIEIAGGNAMPITTDTQNPPRWIKGQKPSVGAAVHQYLIDKKVKYQKGGNFR
jgi:hypothetical protein